VWILANGEATVRAGGADRLFGRAGQSGRQPPSAASSHAPPACPASRRHGAAHVRAAQMARDRCRTRGDLAELAVIGVALAADVCKSVRSKVPAAHGRSPCHTRAGGGPSSPGMSTLELCSAGARWVNASAAGEELGSDSRSPLSSATLLTCHRAGWRPRSTLGQAGKNGQQPTSRRRVARTTCASGIRNARRCPRESGARRELAEVSQQHGVR
jgi:hypothetical protein